MTEKKPEAPFLNLKHPDAVGKTEEFKRPNHADFMTAAELAKIEFTGVRHNTIARDFEFWALGIIKKRVHESVAKRNPDKMIKIHLQVYGFIPPDESGIILPQAAEGKS